VDVRLGQRTTERAVVCGQGTRAVTGRIFQLRAGFGFLPQKSGGFWVNPPDNFFRAFGWSEYLSEY